MIFITTSYTDCFDQYQRLPAINNRQIESTIIDPYINISLSMPGIYCTADTIGIPGFEVAPAPGGAVTPVSGGAVTPVSGGAVTPVSGGAVTPVSGGAISSTPGGTVSPVSGATSLVFIMLEMHFIEFVNSLDINDLAILQEVYIFS